MGIDATSNRITSGGYSYDNNGNLTQSPLVIPATYSYDVENRMVSAAAGINGTDTYGYGPDTKRVYKMHPNGSEEYYFWVGSKKLGTYQLGTNGSGNLAVNSGAAILWFGNRKLQTQDRIGSTTNTYYPYGEDRANAPASDADKFATYYRDLTTGLDYADHRYYSSSLGRFLTPDPSMASGGLAIRGVGIDTRTQEAIQSIVPIVQVSMIRQRATATPIPMILCVAIFCSAQMEALSFQMGAVRTLQVVVRLTRWTMAVVERW